MKTVLKKEKLAVKNNEYISPSKTLTNKVVKAVDVSWGKIAPFWPLKNLVAANPMAGFEDLHFSEALKEAEIYFQQENLPKDFEEVNLHTIKYLQSFFDEGQATILMPNRNLGLFKAIKKLIIFDSQIHKNDQSKIELIKNISDDPKKAIVEILLHLKIKDKDYEQFLILMLTTLSGWASYIQYRVSWANQEIENHQNKVSKEDYIAFRILLAALLCKDSKEIILWNQKTREKVNSKKDDKILNNIKILENEYRFNLLKEISENAAKVQDKEVRKADAQIAFCIDTRSEPFRKILESKGNYQTLGFAGFFAISAAIENEITEEKYASCPVLLKPAFAIKERPVSNVRFHKGNYNKLLKFKEIYQSLKYNLSTPFALVEGLGLPAAFMAFIKTLLPNFANNLRKKATEQIHPHFHVHNSITEISLQARCEIALSALRMMGLVKDFASLVIFCGHGSTTQNNAYATILDCGACSGRHGDANARILAEILNQTEVREFLQKNKITVPDSTIFLAAKHNTTTDEVEIFDHNVSQKFAKQISQLKENLKLAKIENSWMRSKNFDIKTNSNHADKATAQNSFDWAQVRPEWGLAKNASFIVAPRNITKNLDLKGRSFMHSYDYKIDNDGALLTTILTAPMVVAQWINGQYLFSTLDSAAFGGGSKITKNITGKMGIMQGNASDLMTGLPLQSVYSSDHKYYHQPLRLMTVVYAPRNIVSKIINEQEILQKLCKNEWIAIAAIEPEDSKSYILQNDLTWEKIS